MKNMDAYIMISIVSLILVVATAFLMIAADAPIHHEERSAHRNAHNAA